MTDYQLLWEQPGWQDSARAWIERSLQVTGAIEHPYIRPWSTVMRVPTADGIFYFKALGKSQAGELTLTQALAARAPDVMPEIAAYDLERGWMLMRDAGTPLRELLHSAEDLRLLDPVLPRLAELQMAWLGQQDELVRLGALDQRVEGLPGRFERLLEDGAALKLGQPDGLSEDQLTRLRAIAPGYRELCDRLLQSGIPQSIHYDDMHTSNVFFRDDPGGQRVTFLDWGDAAAGHPFSSLLIFLRELSDSIGLPESATERPETLPPALARVRDAYLESWEGFGGHEKRVETFNLAWRVGMVSRALAWHAAVERLDPEVREEYRYAVPAWLGEFLLAN